MEKSLPVHVSGHIQRGPRISYFARLLALCSVATLAFFIVSPSATVNRTISKVPRDANQIQAKCRALNIEPGPPSDFYDRTVSDRFVEGTKPVLIRNATIWTGRVQGLEVLHGDIYIDGGIIKALGQIDHVIIDQTTKVIDAGGAFVTPGIVDVHSHMGVEAAPSLSGADDTNSLKGPILPWLRSIDGLNTHDDSYQLAVAGGVTTSLILPGSANAIGGQAFVIKPRQTNERSPQSLLLEPPFGLNGTTLDHNVPPRWKHIKHACGENPSRVYSATRMDTAWAFREAYSQAAKIKKEQDTYCEKALADEWTNLGSFPEELKWEALVDVLRGHVKVQTHCYEAVDFDSFIRLTNEFQFPVAAFHHAHEAYLVPDLLKKAYEHPPAVAIFASFSRYKREAYRHSTYAPKILHDAGIKVLMKTDHPAIVSRYLLHEAQQAHYYGLPTAPALASVISTPAEILGLDHRIGYLKEGYDADLVIWDSHPLTLGATPKQVFIDGISQIAKPYPLSKPSAAQLSPKTPNFDHEGDLALEYDGLPPLDATQTKEFVMFTNVTSAYVRVGREVKELFDVSALDHEEQGVVGVQAGEIVCTGERECERHTTDAVSTGGKPRMINLERGSIQPGLVTYGSKIGLQHIAMESSTVDGPAPNLLSKNLPKTLGDLGLIRAVDGLQYGSRDALLAYRAGVTTAITSPSSTGFLSGLSVKFSLGAAHKLEKGALIEDVVALHIAIRMADETSTSTQIATLRRLLLDNVDSETGTWFKKAADGSIRLVVDVENADIMATLLRLKSEVDLKTGKDLKMTFTGGTESHIVAKELSEAGVGVIVTPPRSFPYDWERKRIIPGPPLTPQDLVSYLVSQGVTVAIGPQGIGQAEMNVWAAQNLRFDAGWVHSISNGQISKSQAFEIASTNIDALLGLDSDDNGDLVATRGGDLLGFEGKVVGVVQKKRGIVDLF